MNHYSSLSSCLVTQSYPTLFDPMDCSLPSSSVSGLSQARILEWVASSSSKGCSSPRDWNHVSCIAGKFFTTRKVHESLLFISNGAMKILFLLFCFMFVGCFPIFHLNIWWAFLWPHLVTSDFAPLWGNSHGALNPCLVCWYFLQNLSPTFFSRKEISKILRSSYLRGMNLASFFTVSKIMIFVTFISNELLDSLITGSQVFMVVMLFEALRFSSTFYFPMAVEKVSEAVVSIQRIKV